MIAVVMDTSGLSDDHNSETSSNKIVNENEGSNFTENIINSGKDVVNRTPLPESPRETDISNISLLGVQDEDVVLGGDESARDFEGNIDEDELLKDPETDDNGKNKGGINNYELASNSCQLKSAENNNLDNNKYIRGAHISVKHSKKELATIEVEDTCSTENCIVASSDLEDKIVLQSSELKKMGETSPDTSQIGTTSKDTSESDAFLQSLNETGTVALTSSDIGNETETISSNTNNKTHVTEHDKTVFSRNEIIVEPEGSTLAGNPPLDVGRSSANTEENEKHLNNSTLSKIIENSENVESNTNSVSNGSNVVDDNIKNVSDCFSPDNEDGNSTLVEESNIQTNSCTTTCRKDTVDFVNESTDIKNDEISKTLDVVNGENYNSEENDEGTKFLHVDQDSSRPDETFDTVETGDNDPFAHTSDDTMEVSGNCEKYTDFDKAQQCQMNNELMDVDENPDNEESQHEKSSNALAEQNNTKEQVAVPVERMATGDNDTFSQTSDDTIEKSGNCVKDTEFEKAPQYKINRDVMDVDKSSDKNSIQCKTPSNSAVIRNIIEKELIADSLKCITSSDKTTLYTHPEKSSTTSEKSTEDQNTSSQSNTTLPLDNCQDADTSIVPDKFTKAQETYLSESENTNSSRSKTSKMSSKSKLKSKKSSSDDSTDSDFETNIKLTPRPKRNAAKKAESQIKVMSAVEREADQEDVGSNDADSNGVEEISIEQRDPADLQQCLSCKKLSCCKINAVTLGKTNYFCDDTCHALFQEGSEVRAEEDPEIVPPSSIIKDIRSADIQPIDREEFIRKCSQCFSVVKDDDEKTLSWETMDFCSEECLGKFQQELGSYCANCKGNVQPASLGKYCVRFGYEVKQFCCSSCLEEFKKGLKVCSFCQKDISSGAEGFLAPVGDKGTFKDFCTQACMEKYEQMSSNQLPPPQMHSCDVCDNNKLVEVEVFFDSKVNKLCSDICFTAYKFANKLKVDRCDMCRKYFDKDANGEKFHIFYDGVPHNFCCKTCMNVYILAKRKIVPCNWCKVKKYNFDMIKRVQNSGQVLMMCSLNCLTLYQVSVNAVSSRRIKCDMCMSVAQAQYHLTMSDATIRNFCTYPCVMNFQQQYSKSPITLPGSDAPPIPTGAPKRVVQKNDSLGAPVPVISSITSLANGQPTVSDTSSKVTSGKLNLVTRLLEPPVCRNKNTQTRPVMNSKSVSCRPHSIHSQIQTEEHKGAPLLIPIPVPIYVPCPMAMYSLPFPVPIPFPLPVPVPMFLPTTKNSISGILKEIKRIQEKVPTDPFEAELIMMAEMVAGDKKEAVSSSDSEADNEPTTNNGPPNSGGETDFTPEAMETSNTFGDDIMQIALKMATELDEPNEDLETQLTPATILNQTQPTNGGNSDDTQKSQSSENKGIKRTTTRSSQKKDGSADSKKRKTNHNSDATASQQPATEQPKPDAHMKLKFTFGVNAWKSWVSQKNAEIEKLSSTNKKIKPFNTEILQLTADELNFSLCLFVKEVKKPNGTQYAPDTIYYLCLGIQQYLFENGRIDNIFTDTYFEPFTDSLDEVAKKFTELFNDHHYIVTRVEEEHLWESKQLGAHSPHVLLSTLMFFNTKHFNLTTVDEHMLLSFSHIMKHWKKNPNQQTPAGGGKAPGSRNVLLRFYPPQAVLDDPNSKKKKVYEQQENEENPLRCPVKLYEFYLSKCPESVKSRNDVFYLQPERSCVPDSPVWYSTMALGKEPLDKMLNRVKMVKEINIALLMP